MNKIPEIKAAMPLAVESLEALARYLVSSYDGQQHAIFCFEYENNYYYAALVVITGYYELQGLPTMVYCEHKQPTNKFIRYDIRDDCESPLTFVKGFRDRDANLGYVQYFPLIQLKSPPSFFSFE